MTKDHPVQHRRWKTVQSLLLNTAVVSVSYKKVSLMFISFSSAGAMAQTTEARRNHGEETKAGLLLLGEHVLDQVTHTVAVAKLVVVPAGGESSEVMCILILLWIYRLLTRIKKNTDLFMICVYLLAFKKVFHNKFHNRNMSLMIYFFFFRKKKITNPKVTDYRIKFE